MQIRFIMVRLSVLSIVNAGVRAILSVAFQRQLIWSSWPFPTTSANGWSALSPPDFHFASTEKPKPLSKRCETATRSAFEPLSIYSWRRSTVTALAAKEALIREARSRDFLNMKKPSIKITFRFYETWVYFLCTVILVTRIEIICFIFLAKIDVNPINKKGY